MAYLETSGADAAAQYAEYLEQHPVDEHQYRRYHERRLTKPEYHEHVHVHVHTRVEDNVRSHNTADGAGCAK